MEVVQEDPLYAYAKQLIGEGKDIEEIKLLLLANTESVSLLEEVLKRLKKEKHALALKSGKAKIGIAVALMVSGFVLSIIQYHFNHSFFIFLYGFTTVGTLVLFWGAYDIFN
jgi:NAD(P)H-flavin reductase